MNCHIIKYSLKQDVLYRTLTFVLTVGLDEEIVRKYIREQEKNDELSEQQKFDW